jgi:GTP-binding protein Era
MTEEQQQTRAGFIAVVGAPNAGKSTFVNKMVGAKVAIVTPKVQTTRHRVLGIVTHEQSQLIFIDTPGVFQAKAQFERAMVKSAFASIAEADMVALLVDACKGMCDNTRLVMEAIAQHSAKKIVIINKVDKVVKTDLLLLAKELFDSELFEQCFMISAMKGEGVADVKKWLAENMPLDTWHFPEDQLTDMPLRQWAAETTRESLFYRLKQEVPYGVAVETESWEEKRKYSSSNSVIPAKTGIHPAKNTHHNPVDSRLRGNDVKHTKREDYIAISQVIYVQNDNQKKIILGKQGAMLKEIGVAARIRMERFLGQKVHLSLFVKVAENWKEDKQFYQAIGLDYQE